MDDIFGFAPEGKMKIFAQSDTKDYCVFYK